MLRDEELAEFEPERSRELEVLRFVEPARLDHRWYVRPYYLGPAGDPDEYFAFARALAAEDGLLRAETLRFASQLRTPEALGLPAPPKRLATAAVRRMRGIIRAQVEDDIDPGQLDDETRAQTLALAERKLAEGRDVVDVPTPEPGAEAEVIDLMQVLERSLARPSKAVS